MTFSGVVSGIALPFGPKSSKKLVIGDSVAKETATHKPAMA
jgi:hypothetical protein